MKTDLDLVQAALKKWSHPRSDGRIQIPLDAEVTKLQRGAWVEARLWVDYEEVENG